MICALMFPTEARAETAVRFDCFLSEGIEIQCREIAQAYRSSIPGLTLVEDATLFEVRLRSTEVAGGFRFFADFSGHSLSEPEAGEPLQFTITEDVPRSAGNDRTLLVLVALLQRGTLPFLRIDAPGEPDGDLLRVTATATQSASHDAGSQATGWYARPMIAGEFVSAGIMIATAQGGLELNYSDPEWRFRLISKASYRYLNLSLGDSHLEGSFVELEGETVLARSLGSGFSLALIGAASSKPQNNLDSRAGVALGVEWVLASFLRANETNIGTRLTLWGYHDDYVTPNIEARDERFYADPSFSLFGRVHTDIIDIEANASFGFVLDEPRFWTVGGELETSLRVFDGLSLALELELLYRGAALHAPMNSSALNPVATTLAGSDFGQLTVSAELTISWVFGNSLIRSQDQRWR
jgi:hypothetical protein